MVPYVTEPHRYVRAQLFTQPDDRYRAAAWPGFNVGRQLLQSLGIATTFRNLQMNTIPLTDADGSDGLPICRAQREWLVSRYKLEAMIALKFFSDDLPVGERDASTDTKAIEHVRKCPKCRDWLHRIVPADVFRRQSRLSRYCCAGMFVAFEESDAGSKNRVTFELFRGEDPCWMVDGMRSFLSFCPWCGKKLPDKPFILES